MSLLPMIAAETVIVPVINGIPWWLFEGIGSGWWTGHRIGRSRRQRSNQYCLLHKLSERLAMITAERLRPGLARTRNPPSHDFG